MKILICGASGFVGRNIRLALEARGHTVVGAGSHLNQHNQIAVDYALDTTAAVWVPRLEGIDIVINAVGVLRDTAHRPIDAVHRRTPIALFDACSQAHVQHVIQVSALGIEGNATSYATSKRAADEHLLALHAAKKLHATVLRPSIVFGHGGVSSQLFVMLSKLPVLVLPKPVLSALVQPIAIQDLARGIAMLIENDKAESLYECVGAEALPLSGFIASLREQQGKSPARVLTLPDWMTRLSARVGDHISVAPWCTETLALLAHDNVSSQTSFANFLGHSQLLLTEFLEKAWNSNA